MVPVACWLLEWRICLPPTYFLWPISAKFFWIQVFHKTLKENIHFRFSWELQWRGCTIPLLCLYSFSPMCLELNYSRFYEEEIILLSNVTCPFGPYISYIHLCFSICFWHFIFCLLHLGGLPHWTLYNVQFVYEVALPLVSSCTSHSKDDTLLECTWRANITQWVGMLCVSLIRKCIATCMTCATELEIITGFAVLC
jgi:hypothetical protein